MAENYYNQDFADSIDTERTKLLKLLADHGSEGAAIYDEAQARAGARPVEGASRATTAAGIDVPSTLIDEVRGQFSSRAAMFQQLLGEAQDQAEIDMRNRAAAGAIYKDAVAGDDTLRAMADDDIAAASAAGGAGGGGGRGRGRGGRGSTSGFGAGLGGGEATLPAGMFLDQLGPDPEGLAPMKYNTGMRAVGAKGTAKMGAKTTTLKSGATLDALKRGLSAPKAPAGRGVVRIVDGKRVVPRQASGPMVKKPSVPRVIGPR